MVRNAQHLEALVSETAKANLDEFDVAVEIRFDLDEEEVGLHDLSLRRSFHVSKAGISSPEVALTFREGRDYKEITNDADVTRRLDAWFDHRSDNTCGFKVKPWMSWSTSRSGIVCKR